jgi:spore germination protein GerM
MQDHQSPSRRLPLSVLAGISVLILAAGSAVAWWGWTTFSRKSPTPEAVQRSESPQDSKSPPIAANPSDADRSQPKAPIGTEKTLQVYWLKGSGSQIALTSTPVKLSSTGNTEPVLKAALEQLLAGPSSSAFTTTIPRGTELRSVSVQNDGIHINLSQAFMTGGGTTSMTGRVAQVLYTATSLNPNAKVWLSVEGKPLETLGGEGLLLDQPMTRKSFEQNFTL